VIVARNLERRPLTPGVARRVEERHDPGELKGCDATHQRGAAVVQQHAGPSAVRPTGDEVGGPALRRRIEEIRHELTSFTTGHEHAPVRKLHGEGLFAFYPGGR
jgi:hypothetical protein